MKLFLKIIAGLIVTLIVAMGVVAGAYWTPDRPVEELKGRWAPPPSQFVSIDGMPVHLRDEGPRDDPSPIVLLHGTSSSLHTWDAWAQALQEHRRVIRYDMPGFGLTGPSPDGNYSIEKYVQVVTAVLDTLGVKRCVLAGNSLGGYVAWATAVFHPDRVERLILVDASGYAYQSTSVPLAFRIARLPVLGALLGPVLPRGVVESSVRNVYGDPSKVTPELVDRYYDLTTRAGNRQALVERFRQTQPGALAQRVAELKLPTLIIWGGRDRLIPLELGQRFKKEIVGSQLVVFDELGHVPQEEGAAQTVAVANEFLSRLGVAVAAHAQQ